MPDAASPPWHENAIIYQVPVGLLRDTNGNGWGDLDGVTDSLQHIHDLGATAIWLQPFYASPYVDGGYDVIDHLTVSDRFGTVQDFKDLMSRADELGLKVILDLVVQHTSNKHSWFWQACHDRDSKYRDYYIWADEPEDTIVEPVFPTVEDSVWAWSEQAGQYYRHTFYSHEPDLDVGNPDVRDEIRRIMEHWLELGVAGFRVDAVPYMVLQAAQSDPRENGFWFLEELHDLVRKHRPDGVLIAESDVEPAKYADYFGDGNRFTMLLNFWLNNHLFLSMAREEAEPLLRALKDQPRPPDGCQYATWLRNHDELDLEQLSDAEREETMAVFAPEPEMRAFGRGIRRRLAPMLADPRRLKQAMFLLCALPGTPVMLYGDEIGMGEDLGLPDRASVRTPMQWTGHRNAGFSTAAGIELIHPVIDDGPFGYHHVNVTDQSERPESLLETLKHLFELRKQLGPYHSATAEGVELDDAGVLAVRHRDGTADALMLANLSAKRTQIRLPDDHRDDWVEVVADHAYDSAATDQEIELHGYGYRWFRLNGSGS
ncbi:MAG TPA: alpha-amylase family protein [Nocardioidaceae bacterium]|nr:alpha-amylase family protein [Nocardioidaceae bacterium]